MTTCPHHGFHRTDAELAACLRERLEKAERINTPLKPCPDCGAMTATCCATSHSRNLTATSLASLVDRQAKKIAQMDREIEENRQIIQALKVMKIDGSIPKGGA